LRVRASGTEPINRIYVESSDPHIAQRLMQTALRRLEELSAAEIENADSEWRLAEILSTTTRSPALVQQTKATIASHAAWQRQSIISKLERMLPTVERRNQHAIQTWIKTLSDET
jgi:hypothetical protein